MHASKFMYHCCAVVFYGIVCFRTEQTCPREVYSSPPTLWYAFSSMHMMCVLMMFASTNYRAIHIHVYNGESCRWHIGQTMDISNKPISNCQRPRLDVYFRKHSLMFHLAFAIIVFVLSQNWLSVVGKLYRPNCVACLAVGVLSFPTGRSWKQQG